MREMVFRERQEKVANFSGLTKALARVFSMDSARMFDDILAEYASEVFQEDYDADLLRRKIEGLRVARRTIEAKRNHEKALVSRLDRMGEYYDQKHGKDIRQSAPSPSKVPTPPKRVKPPSR